MRNATLNAVTTYIFRQNNDMASSDKDGARRVCANNIIQAFLDISDADLLTESEYRMLDQLSGIVKNAVEEIERQEWQEYTEGYAVARAYIQ